MAWHGGGRRIFLIGASRSEAFLWVVSVAYFWAGFTLWVTWVRDLCPEVGVGGGVACCALRSSQTSVYSWPGVGLRATGGGVGRLLLLARQY